MTDLEKRLAGALEWVSTTPNEESRKNAKDVLVVFERCRRAELFKAEPRTLTMDELDRVGAGWRCPSPSPDN